MIHATVRVVVLSLGYKDLFHLNIYGIILLSAPDMQYMLLHYMCRVYVLHGYPENDRIHGVVLSAVHNVAIVCLAAPPAHYIVEHMAVVVWSWSLLCVCGGSRVWEMMVALGV